MISENGGIEMPCEMMSRRTFIVYTAGLAGASALATCLPGSTAYGDDTTGVEKVFNTSVIKPSSWPDGKPKVGGIWAVNGQLPGPTIRAKEGETITVRLCNNLSEPTTIHWHGMHQRGTWFMDGVEMISQKPIPPGQCYVYRFKAEPHGTHWYHSHTGVQHSDGLFGALIVEEKNDPYKDLYDFDSIVMMNDWFHQPSPQILANLEQGKYRSKGGPTVGDVPFQSALINGKGRYDVNSKSPLETFTVSRGDRIRFRLINASSTYGLRFAIDGHPLTVIAADGGLTKPYQVDSLILAIGDRYDVIVTADQPVANYWIRASTLETDKDHGVSAILNYKGAGSKEPSLSEPNWGKTLNVMDLDPYEPEIVVESTAESTHVLTGTMKPYQWMIDDKVFGYPKKPIPQAPNPSDPPTTQLRVKSGDVVRLILNNDSPMSHPFHLHGNSFQVLGVSMPGAGKYKGQRLKTMNPIRKDNLDIPNGGWAVIQWKADNPGWWFFHCHIEWHLATGMALVVREGDPPPAP
jgi:iron transport multicopper oxidase